jgi:hypothetical protein
MKKDMTTPAAGVKETTGSYLELTSAAYTMFVDAYAAANRRGLEYWKSVYEIASRPYASSAIEATVRDNFDRANQLASLTVGELQKNGQSVSDLAEKLAAHGSAWQETIAAGFRGAVETGVSNMTFVKETATHQLDEISKRMDEAQARVQQVSQN